jgi:hypothetical protein
VTIKEDCQSRLDSLEELHVADQKRWEHANDVELNKTKEAREEYWAKKKTLDEQGLDGLFTPLQTDAFQLAKDIQDFLKGVEPIPRTSPSDTQAENIGKLKDIFSQRDKFDSAFKLRFEERGTKLERRFKEIANPISHLPIHEIHSRSISKEGISLYTASIVAATHRIDGVMLEAKAP